MKSRIFKKYVLIFVAISSMSSMYLICAENHENNQQTNHVTDEHNKPTRTLTQAERERMYTIMSTSPVLKLHPHLAEEKRRWKSTTNLSDEDIVDKMFGKRAFLLSMAGTLAFFNPALLATYAAAYSMLIMNVQLRRGKFFDWFNNKPVISDHEPVVSELDVDPVHLIRSLYTLDKNKQFQKDFAKNPEQAEADLEKNILAHQLGYTMFDWGPMAFYIYDFSKKLSDLWNELHLQEALNEYNMPRATAEPIYPEGAAKVMGARIGKATNLPTATEMPMTVAAPSQGFWQGANIGGGQGEPVHLTKPVWQTTPVAWPHRVDNATAFASEILSPGTIDLDVAR